MTFNLKSIAHCRSVDYFALKNDEEKHYYIFHNYTVKKFLKLYVPPLEIF